MRARWLVGTVGGLISAVAWGALATSWVPGRALNGIALGVMTTIVAWLALAVGAMATPQLRRYSLSVLVSTLLGVALCAWRVWG